jgi:hypothetical protein
MDARHAVSAISYECERLTRGARIRGI